MIHVYTDIHFQQTPDRAKGRSSDWVAYLEREKHAKKLYTSLEGFLIVHVRFNKMKATVQKNKPDSVKKYSKNKTKKSASETFQSASSANYYLKTIGSLVPIQRICQMGQTRTPQCPVLQDGGIRGVPADGRSFMWTARGLEKLATGATR